MLILAHGKFSVSMEIPETVGQNEVCMRFWTGEREIGVWDFKGKMGNSQGDEKEQSQ